MFPSSKCAGTGSSRSVKSVSGSGGIAMRTRRPSAIAIAAQRRAQHARRSPLVSFSAQ